MALIVEDGSTVTNANSYVSVADFEAYNLERGTALGGLNGTSEQLLLKAMSYIEGQTFIGEKNTKEQALQWPRSGAMVDGFLVEDNEIPKELTLAQIETAIAIDSGNDPLSILERETKSEKVGDIQVVYSDGAKDTVELRYVNIHLEKITVGGSGHGYVEVVRA